jgi:hypothetical protein
MPIVIGTPTVEADEERITYRAETDGFPGEKCLWFSVPIEAAPLLNDRVDAALVALLMPAMSLGQDVVIDGPISDELVWNARGEVQEILRRLRPELAAVEIDINNPMPPLPPGTAVATGYSAGVDSYATLARFHFSNDVPSILRVTHLLYNNVGSHGHGQRGSALYRDRLDLLRPNALSTGLPLIDVDSNLDDFYLAAGLAFQPSHSMRNAAVVHLLSAGVRHYFYASSVPYDDIACAATFDLGFGDPLLLPFLSTRSLTLQPSGTEMDRSAKTALVAEIPHTYERLDVCVESRDGTNCSECWKCHRTMLTLDLLGALPKYDKVFKTPRNPCWKEEHIVQALMQDMPSARSIVRLYDERVGISFKSRAEARRRLTSQFTRRAWRFLMRRISRARTR